MISDIEAAHILIALSRSKPRVVVEATEREDRLSFPVPRQKRSYSRVPCKMIRSLPMMDPSRSSTALVEYASQEDASPPRTPRLSRKKRRPRASSSTALVQYESQEDASPPRTPSLSRKKRRPRASSSTETVEYASEEDASPPRTPSLRRKKRRSRASSSSSTALVEYSSQEDASPKRPKKKRAKLGPSSWSKDPTPDWLLKLMKDEEEPRKIIEKLLSATDVNSNNNRLSMPCSKIIDPEFLSLAEQGIIEVDDEKKQKTGINAKLVVKFVDSEVLKEFSVNLRKWNMPKDKGDPSYIYNLVTGWNDVVERCGLRKDDRIRVWSYHSDRKLCFAIALATPSPPASDSEDANPEEMSSDLVVDDKSDDDLQP